MKVKCDNKLCDLTKCEHREEHEFSEACYGGCFEHSSCSQTFSEKKELVGAK